MIGNNLNSFRIICDNLANADKDLKAILDSHSYPPLWTRRNTFESLVHIILEQQVSLASALAALNQLKKKLGRITPKAVLELTDQGMKDCYVSRQKMVYIRGLATALHSRKISLKKLENKSDDEIRKVLIQLKGIGNWTIDVYLMFVLQRADIFPIGDLALIKAVKRLKNLSEETSREKILRISCKWKPNRTVASMMLWHYYLSESKRK